jgi:hypothetical protein
MEPNSFHEAAVGMTMKQMVTEVYNDVKVLRTEVAVLQTSDLPRRVSELEYFRSATTGGAKRVGAVDATVRGWLQPVISVGAIITGVVIALVR